LRLAATEDIYDTLADHILAAMARRVRQAARGHTTLLVTENEPQQTKLVRPPARGGYGLDALWNDDLHHSAMVGLTGHHEAYYTITEARPKSSSPPSSGDIFIGDSGIHGSASVAGRAPLG
jgi:maltooligosyltrehalose trehalohydrolase